MGFQKEFVEALEGYLLDFCQRREMSALGTQRLLQVVTTQMSRIGFRNSALPLPISISTQHCASRLDRSWVAWNAPNASSSTPSTRFALTQPSSSTMWWSNTCDNLRLNSPWTWVLL